MYDDVRRRKEKLIKAGYVAVDELIKVAEAKIINKKNIDISSDSAEAELAADKMKNAAQAKKLAMQDAFEILAMIEREQTNLDELDGVEKPVTSEKKKESSNFTGVEGKV